MIPALTLMLIVAPALAGEKGGNGGAAVVCRDPLTSKVDSAQLLELWQAPKEPPYGFNVQVPESAEPYQTQAQRAFERIAGRSGPSTFSQRVQEGRAAVGEGTVLPLGMMPADLDDLGYEYQPEPPCRIEYAARFGNDGFGNQRLELSQSIWDKLSPTSRAALYVHEAVYWALRSKGFGDTTSKRTREVVAWVFSGAVLEAPGAGVPLDAKACRGGWPYPSGGQTVLQLEHALTRTTVTLPVEASTVSTKLDAAINQGAPLLVEIAETSGPDYCVGKICLFQNQERTYKIRHARSPREWWFEELQCTWRQPVVPTPMCQIGTGPYTSGIQAFNAGLVYQTIPTPVGEEAARKRLLELRGGACASGFVIHNPGGTPERLY
jgi:hypothetical protein